MIDLISVFSRALGGSCGSVAGDNATRRAKRVKSPRKGTSAPSSSQPQVVRFDENRDDSNNFKKMSLIDMMSASDESRERNSAMGSRERLLRDDNPLAILERRNVHHNDVVDSNEQSSDEDSEHVGSESQVSSSRKRLKPIDNVRKRGLKDIGQFLPSLTTAQPQNNDNNNNSRRENCELPELLEWFGRSNFTPSCPQCSAYLRYSYVSSPRDLVDMNEGRDSPRTKLRNVMPPYCYKCQAYLLFDQNQTKEAMIENLERWLEMNLDRQTKGKIIFVSASPINNDCYGSSPRVTIEFTPRRSKRGSVQFSFNDAEIDPLPTASSLTDILGIYSKGTESKRNDYIDQHSSKCLFASDSTGTSALKELKSQSESDIQLVSTESEERAILQQYSTVKNLATDSITKHLKMHYDLTSDLCDRCQMPMMKMDDSLVYCIVCPVIDKRAKKSAKRKRKKMRKQKKRNQQSSHYASAISNESQSAEESRSEIVPDDKPRVSKTFQQGISNGNARLTALEEGRGFIYSPKNQGNNIAISSCMSNDYEAVSSANCTVNMPPVCNSQSSDQASFPSVQQNQSLQQLSYYDHVNNQYSVGIEYTYSIHQQKVPQSSTTESLRNSSLASTSSNTLSQTSTASDTKCPRDLPPSQMIWSPENNTNRAMQFSFNETKNNFGKEDDGGDKASSLPRKSAEIQHDVTTTKNKSDVAMEMADGEEGFPDVDESVSVQPEAEMIEKRIARLSHSVMKLKEETRDDNESVLDSNRQLSFEGPLLTPHMFNASEYNDREEPEIAHQVHKPCDRERITTVRVFGKTMIQSPRSQCESLSPLFSPPTPEDGMVQHRDGDPAMEMNKVVMSKAPVYDFEQNKCAQLPPQDNPPRNTDMDKFTSCSGPLRGAIYSPPKSTPIKPTSSLRFGETLREQDHRVRAVVDPPTTNLSTSRPDCGVRFARTVAAPSHEYENSSKQIMDPPGRRLTKRRDRESESVDPPAAAVSIDALDTPKHNNRRRKEHISARASDSRKTKEDLHRSPRNKARNTLDHNNSGKINSWQSRSRPQTLTPQPASNVKSKRKHKLRDTHLNNTGTPESKQYECNPIIESKSSDSSQTIPEAGNNVLVTIPTWVDEEIINSPLKSANSFGDSSVEKLIQQIDDIEADFGSIMSSVPKSSPSPLHTKTNSHQYKKETKRDIALSEVKQETKCVLQSSDRRSSLHRTINKTQAVQTDNSFDSDSSEDSVLTSLADKIRYVHHQIDQLDSSDESDDDEPIVPADSQEEMLQLISRLNNAAESLRTFADFQD